MALERCVDIEMLQQDTTCACIFCENQIDGLQYLNGTEGHILQVTNRCRNDIQHLSETTMKGYYKLLIRATVCIPLEMGHDIADGLIEGTQGVQIR